MGLVEVFEPFDEPARAKAAADRKLQIFPPLSDKSRTSDSTPAKATESFAASSCPVAVSTTPRPDLARSCRPIRPKSAASDD